MVGGVADAIGDHLPWRKGVRLFGLTIGLVVLSLCVVWIYFSGIGSYAVCRWDYAKHNLLFTDLLAQYLPIETSFEGRRFILHYSFAFYIIPVRLQQGLASLGLGVGLNAVLLLTYSAVLFLAVWLLARGRAVTSLILLLVLILVGGLDILGMVVFNVEPDIVVSLPSLASIFRRISSGGDYRRRPKA